jgi:predicted regulator of Ras-like GTPase activity (Roadblock/LC7/MglB family)
MTRTALLAAALAALLGTAPAHAQSSQDGTVYQIRVRATDGLVYVYLVGPRTTAPGCATDTFFSVANETSVAGRQQLAMLTMAQAAGKRVTIYGTGACARWPSAEDIAEVVVWD